MNLLLPETNGGFYAGNGEGQSQGFECFIEKNQGIIQGWASYGLSSSKRTYGFDRKVYDANFDQRHILNVNIEWQTGKKDTYWPAAVQLIHRFETGRPYTPIVGATKEGNLWIPQRGEINSQRLANYNNLNLRIEWLSSYKPQKFIRSYFEIWNVLNAKNPININTKFDSSYPNGAAQTFSYAYRRLFGGGVSFDI